MATFAHVTNPPRPIDLSPKKRKTSKTNTAPDGLTKNGSYLDYLSDESFRFFPEKHDWRKRLCYSLYSFAEEKDEFNMYVVEVLQFCDLYKIPYRTLMNWVRNFPDVAEAYAYMKTQLGSRRRIGALHRRYDKDVVFKDLHLYDPEWDEVNKYHAALKTDQAANETKVVVIERMPSTDKVPEKK